MSERRRTGTLVLITWKDGKFLDEKEFVMTGFTAKRLSETKLARILSWLYSTCGSRIILNKK